MNNPTNVWEYLKGHLLRIIENVTEGQVLFVVFLLVAIVFVKYIIDKDIEKKDKAALDKTALLAKSLAKSSGLFLQEKRKFETVLNTLPESILFVDFEGEISWANTAFNHKYAPASLHDAITKKIIPYATDMVDGLMERGNKQWPVPIDYKELRKKSFAMQGSVGPLFDEEGNHSSYYIILQK